MENKKKKTREGRKSLSSTQEVLYQSDFKAADRAFQRSKGNA
ncbi:YfhE family protein [Evansella cellulosilytica]|uniref:YfhE family protein n=1 Tax=Evansella cellulosilytica (strain ATCC 21833 / DSM 2522 / FERM P-1141 / JCM 9156 / N-4) TaxID=649639 RepID=E6U1Y9_EVAC2|nr:YfhE family protein [Evansella cellulosilytica]ADU29233.1 hypothetical protein Bcell_0960 [Evansella cellulosilytica DSM 2522]